MISQTFSVFPREWLSFQELRRLSYALLPSNGQGAIKHWLCTLISLYPLNYVSYYISYTLVKNCRISFFTCRCQCLYLSSLQQIPCCLKNKELGNEQNLKPNAPHSATEVVPYWGHFPWCVYVCVPNLFMLRHLPNQCLVTIKIMSWFNLIWSCHPTSFVPAAYRS